MPKRETNKGLRRKETYGGANINHISPAVSDTTLKSLNCTLTFEEALKLHLSLGQLLGHLNGYDRSTTAGRNTAVNLCIYPHVERVVVVEGKAKEKAKKQS